MLDVFTSHFSTTDPDRVDVTRGSGSGNDLVFAPSWTIVRRWKRAFSEYTNEIELKDHWQQYTRSYYRELDESRQQHPMAWVELLGRGRVVLVCYCLDARWCHRTLLGKTLESFGARFLGELAPRYRSDD